MDKVFSVILLYNVSDFALTSSCSQTRWRSRSPIDIYSYCSSIGCDFWQRAYVALRDRFYSETRTRLSMSTTGYTYAFPKRAK
ncbi:MAG: hypothetical protein V7K47_19145 [Nostoc sp.]